MPLPATFTHPESRIGVRSFVAVSLVWVGALVGAAALSDSMSTSSAESLYLNNCAVCHGIEGRGDGDAAYLVFPKPRDFTSGVFRFKSTPQGQPPTVDDVVRNVTNGIARTAMPAFNGVLTDQEIAELAQYILEFNEGSSKNVVPVAIEIPPPPDFNAQLIAEGSTVYQAMRCAQCHGETGRGDGPSSYDLVDANGFPLPPADYTTGVFKSGDRPEDLYRSIMVGVPGTPMPSFQAALDAGIKVEGLRENTNQVWAMVAYLESLAENHEEPGIPSGAVIEPLLLSDEAMAVDPFDKAWSRSEPTPISLRPLWQRKWAARSVGLRVAVNQEQIAFCLEWPDDSIDLTEGVDTATDAAAIMFSLSDKTIPMIPMGGRDIDGNAMTVNVWHWKASRQLDADTHQRHDFGVSSPGAPSDLYMLKSDDPVSGPLSEHDPTYMPGWEVGNLNSSPDSIGRTVFESNAVGFGTLTLQPPDEQSVTGTGRHVGGVWRVVMVRDRVAHDGQDDVALAGSHRIPFAFAVWNGSMLDRDGTKLVSGWHFLKLNP